MDFLVVEFVKENSEEDNLLRSVTVLDDEMSLKMLFLTYQVDIIEELTGESHSTGEFIQQIDKRCNLVNEGKNINSETLFKDLSYETKETDIGDVRLATIQVSLKK